MLIMRAEVDMASTTTCILPGQSHNVLSTNDAFAKLNDMSY